jgi:hypothetical protein
MTPWGLAFVSIGLFLVNTFSLSQYQPPIEDPMLLEAVSTVKFLLTLLLIQLAAIQIFDIVPEKSSLIKLLKIEIPYVGFCIDDFLAIGAIIWSLGLLRMSPLLEEGELSKFCTLWA